MNGNGIKKWIPIILIIFIIAVFVLVAVNPASASAESKVKGDYPTVQEVLDAYEEEEEIVYYDLVDDWEEAEQEYDPELVKEIQRKLNQKLKGVKGFKKLDEDGIFGPATGNAIKLFQYREKIRIDGKCGPDTLKHLMLSSEGVDAWPHYSPSVKEELNKSTNGFGVCVYLPSNKAAFFRQIDGEWKVIRVIRVATGNYKKGYFTNLVSKNLEGDYKHGYITDKSHSYEGRWDVVFTAGDGMHAYLLHKRNGKWVFDDYKSLGTYASHGCMRVHPLNALWFYRNATEGTHVLVIDRECPYEVTHEYNAKLKRID
ncbi:murein L,D-transpeptidase [Candidatus Saccharibacteria bacterium]|nr:murein L,D-transpeptidase [Candidatus Saccharibacteria bacterium]